MERYLLLATACMGCWGEGPVPTVPDGVHVVFAVPQSTECRLQPYIGDVAIADGYLLASVFQYYPNNGCDMRPTQATYAVEVHRVALDGSTHDEYTGGNSYGEASVRVAQTIGRSSLISIATPPAAATMVLLASDPEITVPLTLSGPGGIFHGTGFVADETYGFITATTSMGANLDVNAPNYPCCTSGSNSGTASSVGRRVRWTNGMVDQFLTPATDGVYAETLKSGLVENLSTLFYPSRVNQTDPLVLKSLDKQAAANDMTGVTRATLEKSSGVLTGLAASDTALVWTTGPSYVNDVPPPSCTVWLLDLQSAGSLPQAMFTTTQFSCFDVAIDDTHAYFTIVSASDHSNNGDTNIRLRGIGLARTPLDGSRQVESIRHGIDSDDEGPRRVYVYGDDVYAVDGHVVARVAKSSFAGKADFGAL